MCGIIGFSGAASALPLLIDGLRALEYRGYDSAGVALSVGGKTVTVKSRGRIDALEEKLKAADLPNSVCGVGHTRWATHGEPSDLNAHPHTAGAVTLVHNGIIENYAVLAHRLSLSGYEFCSETDTEVAAALIDFYYKLSGNPENSLFAAADDIRGSFAFGVLFDGRPGEIYAIRRDSPLIAAHTEKGSFIASDVTAILGHTSEYFRPREGVIVKITPGGVEFFDREGQKVSCVAERVDWSVDHAQRSGYAHFMLKEIFEEPEAVRKTLSPRLSGGLPNFGKDAPGLSELSRFRRIHIVGCGTAMHAGLIGKVFIEKFACIPVCVEIASEFRYRDPILEPNDLVILLSQSGETADTLAALRHAKSRGITTLAIVNVIGSSVAREADRVIYTLAGPEIAVASTKAYSVQCAILALFSISAALSRKALTEPTARRICESLVNSAPDCIARLLAKSDHICALARKYTDCEDLFFIGRGIDAALCTEGSLKLKEISYIHSEAYPAGELKHGTISLITDGVPVIALITEASLCEKTVSAIREVRSRGARVLCITICEISKNCDIPCDDLLVLDAVSGIPAAFCAATAMQLFAYHAASLRGLDVDKPRNLAKSVTVE